jgi:hypothetical protein
VVASHAHDGVRRTAPVSELIRSLVADLVLLARREAELAAIELKQKASAVGLGAALFIGAAMIAWFAIATLIAASVLALAIVLPAWAAALIVAVVLLAVAAALVMVGRARIRAATPLAPERSLEAAQEDVAWIRHKTEELKTAE